MIHAGMNSKKLTMSIRSMIAPYLSEEFDYSSQNATMPYIKQGYKVIGIYFLVHNDR